MTSPRTMKLIDFLAEPRTMPQICYKFGVHRRTIYREIEAIKSMGFTVVRERQNFYISKAKLPAWFVSFVNKFK
jgi:predicted DNA-binding transcriptional regulator YafY